MTLSEDKGHGKNMLVSMQGLFCKYALSVLLLLCDVKFRVAVRPVILAITPVWVFCHQGSHLPAHLSKLPPQGLRKSRSVQEPVRWGWPGWGGIGFSRTLFLGS